MGEPIFTDVTGKRWIIISRIGMFLFLCVYSFFLISLLHYFYTGTILAPTLSFLSTFSAVLMVYFFIAIVIGILRLLLFMYFSLMQKRRQRLISTDDLYVPEVSVIIPAYNEEIGIKKTVASVLESNYPIREVLVIDDGSKDKTASIVKEVFRDDRRVKLVRKKNGGKSTALNVGFIKATGEVVITIDADNILLEETITYLVRHFKDENVAAVSGNCKIGNVKKQLAIWQHIEYVTANNLEKRAYDYLNCITIVPGSISAWRKNIVMEAGYYDDDTMAEDTDITLKIINRNYRIIYEERAVTYEECPENIKDFLKQRVRWAYGILQSLWKNKVQLWMTKNKGVKYFAVPNMLLTYLFHLTIPLVDIIFILALINGENVVLWFFLFFFLSDSIASIYAFILGKEKMKPLVWVFVQRLAYRYMIGYITWKSLIIALKGKGIGWNKVARTGSHFK